MIVEVLFLGIMVIMCFTFMAELIVTGMLCGPIFAYCYVTLYSLCDQFKDGYEQRLYEQIWT